ncbi:MAG: aminopeptidase P family protein [Actinomycetota bacterium]|nr:aminopeptidase P family protein [Actinomycetota bacterium]
MTPASIGPAARRAALRERVAQADLDALLVTELINIRYLTGFTGSNAALLVGIDDGAADDRTVFCTDGRYDTQSARQLPELRRRIDRPCDVALIASASGRVGFEATAVSVAAHQALGDAVRKGAELVPTRGLVEQGRAVKDADEIAALAKACLVADQAFADLIAAGGIRVGRTEREVGLDLDQRMRMLGATDPSFQSIIAAGAHSAIPHHSPTDSVLQRGDLVKFDFGALVDGYHSDMTRTVVLGRPADWHREIYQLVAAAQQAGCDAARPGASGDLMDTAARNVISAAGYGDQFVHGLGHGVGLQIHEAPAVGHRSAAIMAVDMCVTVEPGVYLPGRGGVRIEDTGVIRPDGYHVLTTTSKELLVL